MNFGFEKIMDFVMDTDNPNLANLVGTVMDKIIMKYQFFFAKLYRMIKAKNYQKITKALLHHKTSLSLYWAFLPINVKMSK